MSLIVGINTFNAWNSFGSNFLASLVICLPVALIVFVFSDLTLLNQLYYYLVAVKSMSFGMTVSDYTNNTK